MFEKGKCVDCFIKNKFYDPEKNECSFYDYCGHIVQYGNNKTDFKLVFHLEAFDKDGIAIIGDAEGNDTLYSSSWKEIKEFIDSIIKEVYVKDKK